MFKFFKKLQQQKSCGIYQIQVIKAQLYNLRNFKVCATRELEYRQLLNSNKNSLYFQNQKLISIANVTKQSVEQTQTVTDTLSDAEAQASTNTTVTETITETEIPSGDTVTEHIVETETPSDVQSDTLLQYERSLEAQNDEVVDTEQEIDEASGTQQISNFKEAQGVAKPFSYRQQDEIRKSALSSPETRIVPRPVIDKSNVNYAIDEGRIMIGQSSVPGKIAGRMAHLIEEEIQPIMFATNGQNMYTGLKALTYVTQWKKEKNVHIHFQPLLQETRTEAAIYYVFTEPQIVVTDEIRKSALVCRVSRTTLPMKLGFYIKQKLMEDPSIIIKLSTLSLKMQASISVQAISLARSFLDEVQMDLRVVVDVETLEVPILVYEKPEEAGITQITHLYVFAQKH